MSITDGKCIVFIVFTSFPSLVFNPCPHTSYSFSIPLFPLLFLSLIKLFHLFFPSVQYSFLSFLASNLFFLTTWVGAVGTVNSHCVVVIHVCIYALQYSGKVETTENTEWQWPLSGVHSITREKSTQAGESGGACPPPSIISTITYKVVV